MTAPVPILNASGCLDAIAAPEVARTLDAFVTKTISAARSSSSTSMDVTFAWFAMG